MINEILDDVKHRMEQAVSHANMELNKVRTGRANPEMFDSLVVDYYGSMTPLNQVSTISVPEPRLITITPYEKTLIPIIEKAIMDANMGFTPGNNGTAVLVPVPPLSEERRNEMKKIVKSMGEKCKVSIRNIRREGNDELKKLLKNKDISEDEVKKNEKIIQDHTDKYIKIIDEKVISKEKDIMTI